MSGELTYTVEALLFVASGPLTVDDLAAAAEAPPERVERAIDALAERHAEGRSGVVLERVSGGYALRACAASAAACARLLDRDVDRAAVGGGAGDAGHRGVRRAGLAPGDRAHPRRRRRRPRGLAAGARPDRGGRPGAHARQRGAVPHHAGLRPDLRPRGRAGLAAGARGARRRSRSPTRCATASSPSPTNAPELDPIAVRKRTLRAVRRAAALALALTVVATALPAGASAAAKPKLRPVLDLRVSATDATTVTLRWTDRSAGEVRYELAIGTRVVRLAPNARTYRDRPPAGVIRRYTVRACVRLRCAGWSRVARGGVVVPPVPGSEPTLGGCPMFPADNPWNQRVDALALNARSDRYVAAISSEGDRFLHPDFGSNPEYGIPFVVVPASEPRRAGAVRGVRRRERRRPVPDPARRAGGGRLGRPRARAPAGQLPPLRALSRASRGRRLGGRLGRGLRPALQRAAARHAGRRPTPRACRSCRASCAATRWRRARSATPCGSPCRTRSARSSTRPRTTAPARTRTTRRWACACGCAPTSTSRRTAAGPASILTALKRYGLIVADQGSGWYITGANDTGWDDEDLEQLKRVPGSAFEAVETGPIHPPLTRAPERVVVAGAGLLGAAVASTSARRGASVTGASSATRRAPAPPGGSFAWANVTSASCRELLRLHRRPLGEWCRLADVLGLRCHALRGRCSGAARQRSRRAARRAAPAPGVGQPRPRSTGRDAALCPGSSRAVGAATFTRTRRRPTPSRYARPCCRRRANGADAHGRAMTRSRCRAGVRVDAGGTPAADQVVSRAASTPPLAASRHRRAARRVAGRARAHGPAAAPARPGAPGARAHVLQRPDGRVVAGRDFAGGDVDAAPAELLAARRACCLRSAGRPSNGARWRRVLGRRPAGARPRADGAVRRRHTQRRLAGTAAGSPRHDRGAGRRRGRSARALPARAVRAAGSGPGDAERAGGRRRAGDAERQRHQRPQRRGPRPRPPRRRRPGRPGRRGRRRARRVAPSATSGRPARGPNRYGAAPTRAHGAAQAATSVPRPRASAASTSGSPATVAARRGRGSGRCELRRSSGGGRAR